MAADKNILNVILIKSIFKTTSCSQPLVQNQNNFTEVFLKKPATQIAQTVPPRRIKWLEEL